MTYNAEERLIRSFKFFTSFSDILSDHIKTINPRSDTYIVPLGLDASLYPFSADRAVKPYPVVGLIGSFNSGPSFSAGERLLKRLWPEIKRQVPSAKLKIIGRSARDAFKGYADPQDVDILQDVPDTIPYFRAMDVMLYAPEYGSGMKVKVLEAFALGVPVVMTPPGAEGLPIKNGVHAVIAMSDEELVAQTVKLLNDPSLAQAMRVKARKLLEDHCGPKKVIEQVERVYQHVLRARGAG